MISSDDLNPDATTTMRRNQSIYYFMTPWYHDHNEMFQDDVCDTCEWFQVMISSQSIIQKDPYNVMSRQSPGSRTAVWGINDPFVCRLEWRVAVFVWTLILIRTSLAVAHAFDSHQGNIMNHCTLIVILFTSGCQVAKLAYPIAAKSYHKMASTPALFTDDDTKIEAQGSAIAVRVQNSRWLEDIASEEQSLASKHTNSQWWSSLEGNQGRQPKEGVCFEAKDCSSETQDVKQNDVAKDTQEGNPFQNSRYWSSLAPTLKSDSSEPVTKIKRERNPVYIELNSERSTSSEVSNNTHAACEPSHKRESTASKCRAFDPDSASSAKEDLPPKPNELQSEIKKDCNLPRRGVSKSNSQKLAQLKDDAKKRDSDWQALNQRHKQERANLKIVGDTHPVANKQMQPKYDQSEAPSLALHNQSQAKERVFRLWNIHELYNKTDRDTDRDTDV